MSAKPVHALRIVGPGLVIAATGVGAGDLVAAAVSGSRYGFAVVWAAAAGALLKYVLNEALARWQLATGTTLVEGWIEHLGAWVRYVFGAYLVIWSFIVAGALISACGMAAHALVPALSLKAWGVIHSLAAGVLVLAGGYARFEKLIGIFVGVMFVTLVGCALWIDSPLHSLATSIGSASFPRGGAHYVMGVIGGVGGSVTLLLYGYWIREKGWEDADRLRTVRIDLAVAYTLTGIFGLAVMVLAARVLHGSGVEIRGTEGVLRMSAMLGEVIGPAGHWTFLIGFWGAMATSMLGVWQGVPYLFCDFVGLIKRLPAEEQRAIVDTRSAWYRGYLSWLCLPPMLLLFAERPVGMIVLYAVLSALFMPFLAGTLLYMNSRRRLVGERLRSSWISNAMIVLCLLLFAYLALHELWSLFTA